MVSKTGTVPSREALLRVGGLLPVLFLLSTRVFAIRDGRADHYCPDTDGIWHGKNMTPSWSAAGQRKCRGGFISESWQESAPAGKSEFPRYHIGESFLPFNCQRYIS